MKAGQCHVLFCEIGWLIPSLLVRLNTLLEGPKVCNFWLSEIGEDNCSWQQAC